MTYAVPSMGDSSQPTPSCPADSGHFRVHRSFDAFVTNGLAGVVRVLMLLHSRRYAVTNLRIDVREGVVESRVSCSVSVTPAQNALLLEQLRRIPVVVSAYNV
ncbi:hypothetical protein GCM10027445_35860 [Amycolatopsis endophytica]|uniref:ACT domain-containing protein n=1 Tax=Amycolatopsis endophytica TaxID=860233 RepID=A0A853BBL5_9PSEU|nr:hypothetical protein [Amycolatopsis endophytica]NYI92144.1 hypothetical protein [Amycolatopsis endophytica]